MNLVPFLLRQPILQQLITNFPVALGVNPPVMLSIKATWFCSVHWYRCFSSLHGIARLRPDLEQPYGWCSLTTVMMLLWVQILVEAAMILEGEWTHFLSAKFFQRFSKLGVQSSILTNGCFNLYMQPYSRVQASLESTGLGHFVESFT